MLLISPAHAQTAAPGGDIFASILPFLLIIVVFYFLLIRPQMKRAKQHREMVAAIKRGDLITSSGGIRGKVTKAVEGNDSVEMEIAKGVTVEVVRSMVSEVRNADGTPATPPGGKKPPAAATPPAKDEKKK